ncbi:MAG: hypothetical protein L0G99_17345 [Propionibacteriales bacterium]|nr:hypothetical protein [Propionibacteriales bacterium]
MGNLSIHTERLQEFGSKVSEAAPAMNAAIGQMDAGVLEPGMFPPMANLTEMPRVHGESQRRAREVTQAIQQALDTCGRHLQQIAEAYVQMEEANTIPHQPNWQEN